MTHHMITATLLNALHFLFGASRRTGRTSEMVRAYKEGDIIITYKTAEIRWLERELMAYGIENPQIIPCALDLVAVERCCQRYSRKGLKVHLDHYWLEEYIKQEVKSISVGLEYLTSRLERRDPASVQEDIRNAMEGDPEFFQRTYMLQPREFSDGN